MKPYISIFLLAAIVVGGVGAALSAPPYDTTKVVLFEERFDHDLTHWLLSLDGIDAPEQRPPQSPRIRIDAAPRIEGAMAARFELPGTPGTFRSELALYPGEHGLKERWYGQRMVIHSVPQDDPNGFIVMQWHTVVVPGGQSPVLAIWVKDGHWRLRRDVGDPHASVKHTSDLAWRVVPGKWHSWVVHAKWSAHAHGRIRAWLDGRLVYDVTGPTTYVGQRDTPYFKTGIYRPSRRNATTTEAPIVAHATDFRVGREDATYEDVEPRSVRTLSPIEALLIFD